MTPHPTREALDRLAELLKAATPGPWRELPEELDRPYIRIRGTQLGCRYKIANVLSVVYDGVHEREANETRANAALIVAAVNALPALLAMAQDAERYRWLRERGFGFVHDEQNRGISTGRWGDWIDRDDAATLDACIDAAIADTARQGAARGEGETNVCNR